MLTVDDLQHPDLFWALRGSAGNLGIVTELEFRAFAFTTTYAGMLVWDWEQASRVLPTWARWAVDAPDAVTTSFRLLQLPPIPEIPEAFRGRQLVVIDGAVRADDGVADELLAPLRDLDPELDTFVRVPTHTLTRLHMDPEGPTPAVSQSRVLAELPDDAIEQLLAVGGPGSGSTLMVVELRQLGGALARPAPGAGALPSLVGRFVLFAGGLAPTPEMAAQGLADAARVVGSVQPWAASTHYLNFAEEPIDVGSAFGRTEWQRLGRVCSEVDPDGVVLANHPVPRAG